MTSKRKKSVTRRMLLQSVAAAAIFGPLFKATQGSVSAQERVQHDSAPSALKITDMRACRVAANYDYPIIKIYTIRMFTDWARCAMPVWKASP
jgi:hypothetical protein